MTITTPCGVISQVYLHLKINVVIYGKVQRAHAVYRSTCTPPKIFDLCAVGFFFLIESLRRLVLMKVKWDNIHFERGGGNMRAFVLGKYAI